MPKVSVIIPTYNCAKYLIEAINSVLYQTYRDFEIIVVDDGSTDNTKYVLEPFMGRIKYLYKANGGPASARNLGINTALGEYIAFLDSDDMWLVEYLDKCLCLLIKNNKDLVIVDNFDEYYDNEDKFVVRKYITKEKYVTNNNLYESLFKVLQNGIAADIRIVIKKECLNKIGCFDEDKRLIGIEDWDLWLNIAKNNLRISYINEPLFIYRRHNECLCRNIKYSKSRLKNIYYAFKKHKKEAFKKDKSLRKTYDDTLWLIGTESIAKRIDFSFGIKCLFVSSISTSNFKKIFKPIKNINKLLNYFKKK